MGFKPALVCKREHLVINPGWITDTQYIDSAIYQLFSNPINGCVALGTNHHLILPM